MSTLLQSIVESVHPMNAAALSTERDWDIWSHFRHALSPIEVLNHTKSDAPTALSIARRSSSKARPFFMTGEFCDQVDSLISDGSLSKLSEFARLPFPSVFYEWKMERGRLGAWLSKEELEGISCVAVAHLNSEPLPQFIGVSQLMIDGKYRRLAIFVRNGDYHLDFISYFARSLTIGIAIRGLTEQIETTFDAKLQKSRVKSGKMPLVSYNTVFLAGRRHVPDYVSARLGESTQCLHLRRGHPKVPFRKNGDRTPIWIDSYWAGNADRGISISNYRA